MIKAHTHFGNNFILTHFSLTMGIQGLLSFITRNNFLEPYQLRNTNLVIDGMNLEYELYRRYLERCRDDRAFGGDYNHYGAFIGAFFQQLLDCKVTPVVILDGSFKLSKLPTKRERFDKQLEAVKAIYGGDHTAGADIVPLMSSYLFVQVRSVCFNFLETPFLTNSSISGNQANGDNGEEDHLRGR